MNKPLKTFYSVGQNQNNNRWDVMLVDFWEDDKASMMQIDQFDTKEEAHQLADRLQTEQPTPLEEQQ